MPAIFTPTSGAMSLRQSDSISGFVYESHPAEDPELHAETYEDPEFHAETQRAAETQRRQSIIK